MKLGIIAPANESSFAYANKNDLDFLEFCVNGGQDLEVFCELTDSIQHWSRQYKVSVGSIGRWKTDILDEAGRIRPEELETACRLIDCASKLGCPNYICGCNQVNTISLYDNISVAIDFFSQIIEYGQTKGVYIATYNCRKTNFVHNPSIWKIIHGHLRKLGIKFDPSHARYNGGDYLQEALDWGDRFHHVHLKGSMLVNGYRVDEPPAGLDQTDWKTLLAILRVKGYDGGLSIEPHSAYQQDNQTKSGVLYTIQYMKSILL